MEKKAENFTQPSVDVPSHSQVPKCHAMEFQEQQEVSQEILQYRNSLNYTRTRNFQKNVQWEEPKKNFTYRF